MIWGFIPYKLTNQIIIYKMGNSGCCDLCEDVNFETNKQNFILTV